MAISQYILNAAEEQRLQTRNRGLALVRIRYYYICFLASVGIISSIIARSDLRIIVSYTVVSLGGIVINSIIGLILRSSSRSPKTYTVSAYAEILLDIVLATCIVFAQGGFPSRATVLYAVPILSSGVLLLRPSAYVAAGLSGAAYDLILLVRYVMGGEPNSLQQMLPPLVFYPVAFVILAAIVTRFSASNAVNEKQVAYNQLLAMLRQQLRRPGAVITQIVDALEHDESYSSMSEHQQQLLGQLKQENLEMNSMISDLMAASQHPVNSGQAATLTNVSEILREAARSCAMSATRIGNLNLELDEDVKITIDSNQLHTALYNIIDNAFRYSELGTPVDVKLSHDKDFIVIIITDQGRGMSSEQQKNLFQRSERFEDNKPNDPSRVQLYTMGLGLHVSKLIIERFGGFMEIFSKPHVGTKVTIRLPKQ